MRKKLLWVVAVCGAYWKWEATWERGSVVPVVQKDRITHEAGGCGRGRKQNLGDMGVFWRTASGAYLSFWVSASGEHVQNTLLLQLGHSFSVRLPCSHHFTTMQLVLWRVSGKQVILGQSIRRGCSGRQPGGQNKGFLKPVSKTEFLWGAAG